MSGLPLDQIDFISMNLTMHKNKRLKNHLIMPSVSVNVARGKVTSSLKVRGLKKVRKRHSLISLLNTK